MSSATVFRFRIEDASEAQSDRPFILMLYGPPGTGKAFTTTAEAVRLCGEPVPEDRAEPMAIYQRLVTAGRVEFVTFHQSMSYGDFVESRQPMTGTDGHEETASAGFRLETVPGIFRRIAERAGTSREPPSGSDAITVEGRQIFKMSIGRENVDNDAEFFEEAIEGGYALLGREGHRLERRPICRCFRNSGNLSGGRGEQFDDITRLTLWRGEGQG